MTAPMQASKWLSCQLLIDSDEMSSLMKTLGDFSIYITSKVMPSGSELISHSVFQECYQAYVTSLQQGTLLQETEYRHMFSSVWTTNPDLIKLVSIENHQVIVRVIKPVLQLQPHRISYSAADGKFRSMAFGQNCISWGIQFAYPQLFQDEETRNIHSVDVGNEFPNTQLFQDLQRWVRHNTAPTPFIIGNEQINVPMRLGKNCFAWINNHPQLAQNNLKVNPIRKTA